jgi:hypothetical protein
MTLDQVARRLDERAAAMGGSLPPEQAQQLLDEGQRLREVLLAQRDAVRREWLALADEAALARSLTPPQSTAIRLLLRG